MATESKRGDTGRERRLKKLARRLARKVSECTRRDCPLCAESAERIIPILKKAGVR
jgi:hypothetical protein